MSAFIDLTKERFGRLVVIERAENTKQGSARWECRCDCGNIVIVSSGSLRSGGHTQSCGCKTIEATKKRLTTHGMYNTPEYNTWRSMVQRCNNPKVPKYKNYGGRGITVCDKWLKFTGFFEDMGFRPKGLTIERKNNDLGYYKSNCYWATIFEQNRNKRIQKRNKTGTIGVSWSKTRKKYKVYFDVWGKKRLHLGQFVDLEQAIKVRKQAEQKYGK